MHILHDILDLSAGKDRIPADQDIPDVIALSLINGHIHIDKPVTKLLNLITRLGINIAVLFIEPLNTVDIFSQDIFL